VASSDWKKKNYNMGIKVSNADVAGLKSAGSFEANVKKFKASGATVGQREAMNRFYGKARTDAALGSSVSPVNKSYPSTAGKNSPGSSYRGAGAMPKASAPKGPNGASRIGNFVKNELLGVDDFGNVVRHVKKGEFGAAAKSAATGAFELGTTAAAVVASVPTGGGALAGRVAMAGAKQAGKQAIKQGAKHAAKPTAGAIASKAGLAAGKGAVKVGKAALTGKAPIRTGVKATGRGVAAVTRGTAGKAVVGAGKIAAKTPGGKTAIANEAAKKAAQAKAKQYAAKRVLHNELVKSGAGKAVKGAGKSYDEMAAAKAAAKSAGTAASKAISENAKKQAAKKLAKKNLRRGTRRVAGATAIAKSYNYGDKKLNGR
jgi:hypothetical protein